MPDPLDAPTLGELTRTLARIETRLEQMDTRLDREFNELPHKFVTRELYDISHNELRRELIAYIDAKSNEVRLSSTDVANQLSRIRHFAYWSAGGVIALLCSALGWAITHVVHP